MEVNNFNYTEDDAFELLFHNRHYLCADLELQLHELRKVPNLLKVLRKLVGQNISIYPFINNNIGLLYKLGATNEKADTWELSYSAILYILLQYGIELVEQSNVATNATSNAVDPIAKLQQHIQEHDNEIRSLNNELDVLKEKRANIDYEIEDVTDELKRLASERASKANMLNQLQQLV